MSISILEAIDSKPSKAVRFALDGIKSQQKRPDFTIDLLSYGRQSECLEMCYGCIATCTIQELAGVNLTGSEFDSLTLRSEALGFNRGELEDFEGAIDRARVGELRELLDFCGFHFEGFYRFSEEFSNKIQHVDLQYEGLQKCTAILEAAYSFLSSRGL